MERHWEKEITMDHQKAPLTKLSFALTGTIHIEKSSEHRMTRWNKALWVSVDLH